MTFTNRLGLPRPFVDAATSDHRYTEGRYSVTEVLGGTCEAVLKRRHQGEGEEDVADRVWAILGTAVHKVLQESEATASQLQENWLSVDVRDGYELSGIFDLYDDATGTVTDYKTCSVWKCMVGDFDDWRRQTAAYCWMLRELGFDARRGEVVAIMRDHSKRKSATESEYPDHPVMRIGWDFDEEDMREVRREVEEWFDEVALQERVTDEDLEPCGPDQRWHKPDKWAVMKDGRKRAVRVFESEEQAVEKLRELGKGHHIEFRRGEDTKCEAYCPVAEFCPHGRSLR